MAATVSVSPPPRTAASSASRRRSARNTSAAGSSVGSGVCTIADNAPCSAATTQPFLAANAAGGDASASSNRDTHSVAAVNGDVPQPSPHVELAGPHRATDRGAPQHAGVTGVGVMVRQLTDGAAASTSAASSSR